MVSLSRDASLNAKPFVPREIGYANGVKHYDSILIIPKTDGEKTHEIEYLELYRKINSATGGRFGALPPRQDGVRLSALRCF